MESNQSISLPDLHLTAMTNRLTLTLGSVPTERRVRTRLAVSPSHKLSLCPPPCSPHLTSLKNPQNLQRQSQPCHSATPDAPADTWMVRNVYACPENDLWILLKPHTYIFISILHTTTTKTCTVSECVFNRKCSQVSKRKVHTAPAKVMSNTL